MKTKDKGTQQFRRTSLVVGAVGGGIARTTSRVGLVERGGRATLAKDEADEARARGSSCAKLAADAAVVKVEKKNLVAAIASDAAIKGTAKMEEIGVKETKRRMSTIAAEAASKVDDHEAHNDEGSSHVIPVWQESHRRRGSSIAMDAANLINNKKEMKRKGSIVATDASKMAIVFGTADHH
ncbi:hypothetical protein TrRE_jg12864 [Triparma retinervis]|uniref:Uncharacterized protein n=1 Tax=Triparma retinervis TaxID=2557542 RepID=A0A9W7ARM9_9STRA|nr:hypothetical protein TrRE_jg12864 [Triparma retinervis]